MVSEKRSLTEQVAELVEKQKQLDEIITPQKYKVKKIRYPRKLTAGAKNKIKKGKCLILWIKTNGLVKPAWEKIEDEQVLFKENKTMHLANSASILNFLGKTPMLIIPENSMIPYNPKSMEKLVNKKGLSAIAQKIIINNIERVQQEATKKKLGGKWLWIVIGGIVIGYLVMTAL